MNYIYACMNLIHPSDKVLDIGGAAQPFRRANAIIDYEPYEKRGEFNAYFQNMKPHYSKETWVQQDICDSTKPWSFKDKEFDFAVCAQTLEDVRDPLYICREMQRVAKRGFIETPSRFYEQTGGMELKGLCGNMHHRWIVTISPDSKTLEFRFKTADIHLPKFRLKPPFWNRYPFINPRYEALGVLWEDHFEAKEDLEHTIRCNGTFYNETKRLASQIDDLWDQSGKLPVWVFDKFLRPGILANVLDSIWSDKVLYQYTLKRRRSDESLAYEKEYVQNSLR